MALSAPTCTTSENANEQASSAHTVVPATISIFLEQDIACEIVHQGLVDANTTEEASEPPCTMQNSPQPELEAATGTTISTHLPQTTLSPDMSPDGINSSEHVVHVTAKTVTTPADPNTASLLQTNKKRKAREHAPVLNRLQQRPVKHAVKPLSRYLFFKSILIKGLNLSPRDLTSTMLDFFHQEEKKCLEFEVSLKRVKLCSQPDLMPLAPTWFQAWQHAGIDATRARQQYEAGMALWAVQAQDILVQKLEAAKRTTHSELIGLIDELKAEDALGEICKFLPAPSVYKIPELLQQAAVQLALLTQAEFQVRLGKATSTHNFAELHQLLPRAQLACNAIGLWLQPSAFTLPKFIQLVLCIHSTTQRQLAKFDKLVEVLQIKAPSRRTNDE